MFGMFKRHRQSIKDEVEPNPWYESKCPTWTFTRYDLGPKASAISSCHSVQVLPDPMATSWKPEYIVVSTASSEPIARGFLDPFYAKLWVDQHLSEIVEVIEADQKNLWKETTHRLRPNGYVNDKGEWFPLPDA